MGTSLIPEENQFIGFMPLKSYILNKKNIKTGVKCPQEKEDLVRALVIKDALETIGCTYQKYENTDLVSKARKKSPSSPEKDAQEKEIFD